MVEKLPKTVRLLRIFMDSFDLTSVNEDDDLTYTYIANQIMDGDGCIDEIKDYLNIEMVTFKEAKQLIIKIIENGQIYRRSQTD